MPIIYLVLLGAFIMFSSAVILWQVNQIVRGGETNYVIATTGVYMSLFNIFANLLNILLALSGERD